MIRILICPLWRQFLYLTAQFSMSLNLRSEIGLLSEDGCEDEMARNCANL